MCVLYDKNQDIFNIVYQAFKYRKSLLCKYKKYVDNNDNNSEE